MKLRAILSKWHAATCRDARESGGTIRTSRNVAHIEKARRNTQ